MAAENPVLTGVGVVVFNKDGEFLMMKRLSKHAFGTYAVPGGWLEFGETFEEAAAREVKEELDLEIGNIKVLGVTNNMFPAENKHTVAVLLAATVKNGEPKIMEPHKCERIFWHKDWEHMPEPKITNYTQYVSQADLDRYWQQVKGA